MVCRLDRSNRTLYVRTRIDSNGGSITFTGQQELLPVALIGGPGGPSAVGGTLTLSSNRFVQPSSGEEVTPLDVNLEVTQGGPTIPVPFYGPGETAIGHAVIDEHGQVIPGFGHFAATDFNQSGLTSLSLSGTVSFAGPVTVSASGNLAVGTSGVIFADSDVHLNGSSVTIGQPFLPPVAPENRVAPFTLNNQPFYFSPAHGAGALNVSASLVNVGNLSLQNIGSAN